MARAGVLHCLHLRAALLQLLLPLSSCSSKISWSVRSSSWASSSCCGGGVVAWTAG
jgi:hypothetical protein